MHHLVHSIVSFERAASYKLQAASKAPQGFERCSLNPVAASLYEQARNLMIIIN
jgi:hypothetical protein